MESGGDGSSARRTAVLDSALTTFAGSGFRRTSMEAVARSADITRPGLYFLFRSKEELFRDAVAQLLTADLRAIEELLREGRPLAARLAAAFDRWAGRYVEPSGRAITAVIDDNPELVGPFARTASARFAELVTSAIADGVDDPARAAAIAQTLISTSIGLKHQVDTRADHRSGLAQAIDLLVPGPDPTGA